MRNILSWLLDIFIRILALVIEPLSKFIGSKGPILSSWIGDGLFILIITSIIVVDLMSFVKRFRRDGFWRGITFSLIIIVFETVVGILIYTYVQEWMFLYLVSRPIAEFIRWLLLFLPSIAIYVYGRRSNGARGLWTYLAHLGLFVVGWLFGKWIGIFLISLPLLLAFYVTLYYMAVAIVPAADPDSPLISRSELKLVIANLFSLAKKILGPESGSLKRKSIAEITAKLTLVRSRLVGERWKRFLVLFWYLWGFQYPHLVITDTVGRQMETRIPGNAFIKTFAPGLIWCKSNQVIGLTTGPGFGRVAGPGVVFTRCFERPIQIADPSHRRSGSEFELVGCVDLRTQFRSTKIDAVSKDGHPFRAVLFASFSIDRQEEWPRAEYHRLQQANPLLKAGRTCDQGKGIYRYSAARVQAALSTTAINNSTSPSGANAVHWDEWTLNQVCEGARQILSQRNLDELWRPRSDGPGKNALDEIGSEIKALMAPKLHESGIQLNGTRVVDFEILEEDVVKQQVATWKAAWEKRATEMLADGRAEAERLELEAKAYARCMFLTMVADGLEKARVIDPDLPKHVIAMRIIGAMEELLKQQPGATSEDAAGHLTAIKQEYSQVLK